MPIVARGAIAAFALLVVAPASVFSQPSGELQLGTALMLARDRNPAVLAAVLAAETTVELTESAGRWPNPEMQVYQENFPGALPGNTQWIMSLSQRIPIGGRLGAAREQADASRAAVAEEATAVFWQVDLRVRTEYGGAYVRQREIAAVRNAAEATTGLLASMRLRAEEGDASEYDVRRMARELEALETQAALLTSELRGAELRLAALLGVDRPADGWVFLDPTSQAGGPPTLAEVIPDDAVGAAPAAELGDAAEDFTGRPDVAAAMQRSLAAGFAQTRQRKVGVPDLLVSAGYSRLDSGYDGFVWSVGAQLPIFDRNQERVAELAVERAEIDRDVARLQLDARLQRDSARQSYRDATASLLLLAPEEDKGLAGIARTAYEEGEMTVAELVDALRTDLAAAQRRLGLHERRIVNWYVWQWSEGAGSERGER